MENTASPNGTDKSISQDSLYNIFLEEELSKQGDQQQDSQEQPEVDTPEEPSDEEPTEEDLDETTSDDVDSEDEEIESDEEVEEDYSDIPENLAAEYRDRLKQLDKNGRGIALDLYKQFQSGFTTKTQELANIRKEYEAANQQAAEGTKVLIEKINILDNALKARVPQRPDRALLDTNPTLYHKQQAEYQEHQEQLRVLEQERAQALQQHQQQQQERIVQTATQAFEESRNKIPGWKDVEVAKREGKEVIEYIKTKGVGEESIIELAVNPTLQELAWKAMKYEKLMSKKREVQAKTSNKPPVRNLKAKGPSKVSTKTKAAEQFEKSGSLADLERMFYEDALKQYR